MRVAEVEQTKPKQGSSPTSSLVLQRKCACGGSSGISGTCKDCQNDRVHGHPLQTKLKINESGDAYEQEADRVADQVMSMSEPPEQGQMAGSGALPIIQRKVVGNDSGMGVVPPIVQDVLSSPGQTLDASIRNYFEPRFGHDFGQVRIHANSHASESAHSINARAYTVGHNLVFGAGEFCPEQVTGRRLIAHELSHVIQQRQFKSPRYIQRASGNGAEPEVEEESIPLTPNLSISHEIYIEGEPYEIIEISSRSWNRQSQKQIEEYESNYPNLGNGLWAFISDPRRGRFCTVGGNCMGWADGTLRYTGSGEGVWKLLPEYLHSIGPKVLKRRSSEEEYQRLIKKEKIPPQAIWDYFMKVTFNALPTDSEGSANLALYGRGYANSTEGPAHIAFRPKGGNLWLSKPSSSGFPVLHQSASQMTGGQMGNILHLYNREEGAMDHIYMKRVPQGRESEETTTP